jgi:hypothetical protein
MKAIKQKSDEVWESESDARVLMDADVIKNDKKRFSKAIKRAKIMSSDKKAEADSMMKIAKLKVRKKK